MMLVAAVGPHATPNLLDVLHLLVGTIHKLLIVHRLGLLRLRRSYAASYAGRRPSTSVPPFSLLTLNGLSTYFATLIGIA
jgi:hypothetical protein